MEDLAVTVLQWLVGFVPPEYAAPVAALWTLFTAVGAVCATVAAVIKAKSPDGKAAGLLDTIAHWASRIGTDLRVKKPGDVSPK